MAQLRGAQSALRWHDTPVPERGRQQARGRQSVASDSGIRRRSDRAKPKIAIIENAIIGRLLNLSDDAIRVYVTLARFANRYTGFAYPKTRLLLRELNFTPFHTSTLTGIVRLGLTLRQWSRRRSQVRNATARLQAALDELQLAGLLAREFKRNAYTEYTVYVLLHPDGKHRKMARLKKADSFCIVPYEAFASGAFGLWRRWWAGLAPLTGLPLRMFLLAIRDHNLLRYGGISPRRLRNGGPLGTFPDGVWQEALGCTLEEGQQALKELFCRRLLHEHHILASKIDSHVISFDLSDSEPDGEILPIFSLFEYTEVHIC